MNNPRFNDCARVKKDYSNIQNLRDDVKFVSKRLLTALSLGTGVSHVTPLSDSFSANDLLLFDHVINVSDRQFSDIFLTVINHHLQQFDVSIDSLPRCNEFHGVFLQIFRFGILEHILQAIAKTMLFGMKQPQASDYSSSDFDYMSSLKMQISFLCLGYFTMCHQDILKDDCVKNS